MTMRLDDLISGIRETYPDQPLDQLSAAVIASAQMTEVADHLVGHFVDQARRGGASWAEIGGALGVTKQAAQQRFTPKAGPNMFARFTERAKGVVKAAQESAQAGRRTEIEAADLVVGLTAQADSLALRAVEASGVSPGDLRAAAVASTVDLPTVDESPILVPYGASAQKVLELTVREAVRLGHNYVGTEHILLALTADEGDAGLLRGLGITHDAVEAYVRELLATVWPAPKDEPKDEQPDS